MAGKDLRLKRLFRHSDRLFILPLDHGITIGPVPGLTDIRRTVQAAIDGGIDAVVVHKGLVERIDDLLSPAGCEMILHLSASTALAPDPNRKEQVTSVERALELGATAISIHVNLGSAFEAEMLKDFGTVSEQCSRWGIPLLAMMYVRDGAKDSEYDPAKIKHAARVAEELGADLVKVNYTGDPESFAEVVAAVAVPVIIAGGPKLNSPAELLEMVADAVAAGAQGVAIGRNIFQDDHPAQLAATVRQILDQKNSKGKTGPVHRR
ncbi:2-amino-3,7-dideoxy-D-threo-hept-6-ulosonate synthase [Hydrogenispora ethanolica]|uniref:2-amino-3,7-dideoxy-D-threo-hept-6-ulosonate synthase n=1 Tax=Hydrogenispora ethanolica TaxID=1082276 RepID=A0A4R1SBM8_HYDET|nr:2-amino-3,7-dideoxy-D-threo-hept-6-ulosonate synthase [Hydrogenispora ethanolica]TCL76911.1 2-amino-3,7-dideoxy-D-threo-hept-6-ulosonate synthase [Hydrogenispora ethanolica]